MRYVCCLGLKFKTHHKYISVYWHRQKIFFIKFTTDIMLLLTPFENIDTVHPRLSEQVELKFLLGRPDTQKILIIEAEHFTY